MCIGSSEAKGFLFQCPVCTNQLASRKKRAAVAVAHSLLVAIYHVLKEKTAFHDLGSNYYNQFNRERKANSMVKKLMLLGYTVTLEQALA